MTYIPADEPVTSGAPADGERVASRRTMGCALEIVETLVLTLIIYLVIHNFVAQPFEVQQSSMLPTIVQDEYVLIDKLTPRFDDYRRGDVVVFQPPAGHQADGVPFIKRIIGIPGDTVSLRNGRVYIQPATGPEVRLDESYLARDIDGGPVATLPKDAQFADSWTVPEGTYFVMGDNRPVSQDSRVFGPIEKDLIVGRAWLRYFPIDRIGVMDRPEYPALDDDGTAGWIPYFGSSATIQVSISRP